VSLSQKASEYVVLIVSDASSFFLLEPTNELLQVVETSRSRNQPVKRRQSSPGRDSKDQFRVVDDRRGVGVLGRGAHRAFLGFLGPSIPPLS